MKKIFHPNNLIVTFELITIIISLGYLILFNKFNTIIAYILYLLMSFCLISVCFKIYDILKQLITNIISNNKYLSKYHNDYILRYKISLFSSLVINIIYVLFKLISGIYFKSLWLISFSIYYFILVILRVSIIKGETNEYIIYKKVGVILLFINLFLTIIILIIVNGTTLKSYNKIVAIGVAVYTFYLMINSIKTLIKYRKYKSPIITSSKIVNVITSMVSMLSLEIIMLSTFGKYNIEFNEIMIMITGGILSIIIIIISLIMIIKGTNKKA